ncbi:Asp-tRNA(Asn)/Glu-tRNA(Gln) amidotransferase subunit GatB [Oceanithermus sp.]
MYEPVIGLEVHLHLKTKTKMFCSCSADYFGAPPNTHVCPVCLGLPGVLPVPNAQAVEYGIMFALALGCEVPEWTQFHRKHYFYPDMPKNYQISQYDRPIGARGSLEVAGERIGITRVHLEEDAGKSLHPTGADHTLLDFNRAGSPLIELVTEPDIKSPEQARLFLNHLRAIAQTLGISDANPEEGKMRADVNVSVRRPGEPLGTKVEIKNLNSFRSVQRALEYEIERQTKILKKGGKIEQATLGWDENAGRTYLMRTKEGEADYRYMPEPDIPMLHVTEEWLERVRAAMPELPAEKKKRYQEAGVKDYDAEILAYDRELSGLFDAALAAGAPAQALANWLNADVRGLLAASEKAVAETGLTPEHLATLVKLADEGKITSRVAKELLPEVMAGADPARLVKERGLEAVSDEGELAKIVDEVIAANPAVVEQIKGGKTKAINALLGQVMRATRGTARPDLVRKLLAEKIGVEV